YSQARVGRCAAPATLRLTNGGALPSPCVALHKFPSCHPGRARREPGASLSDPKLGPGSRASRSGGVTDRLLSPPCALAEAARDGMLWTRPLDGQIHHSVGAPGSRVSAQAQSRNGLSADALRSRCWIASGKSLQVRRKHDELAPGHSITSSARAISIGGISR